MFKRSRRPRASAPGLRANNEKNGGCMRPQIITLDDAGSSYRALPEQCPDHSGTACTSRWCRD